ncbi:MAG: Molybdopterin synthase sulfur carrier subunit, partial [uncultured Rubrobacteraceae bacterium]
DRGPPLRRGGRPGRHPQGPPRGGRTHDPGRGLAAPRRQAPGPLLNARHFSLRRQRRVREDGRARRPRRRGRRPPARLGRL